MAVSIVCANYDSQQKAILLRLWHMLSPKTFSLFNTFLSPICRFHKFNEKSLLELICFNVLSRSLIVIFTFINMPMTRMILDKNSLQSEFYGNSISDKIISCSKPDSWLADFFINNSSSENRLEGETYIWPFLSLSCLLDGGTNIWCPTQDPKDCTWICWEYSWCGSCNMGPGFVGLK